MYFIKSGKAGFCTISESKRKDAAATWTQIDALLKDTRIKYLQVTIVHFWVDGCLLNGLVEVRVQSPAVSRRASGVKLMPNQPLW